MQRIVSFVAVLVLLLAGALVTAGSAAAVGHNTAPPAKKVCKTKKVHGKKHKVCKTVKPRATPTPSPTPVTELSSGDQIDAWLAQNKFSGYVYLERHGQVIVNRGFGMADAEDKLPNTAQTKWPAFNDNRFLLAIAIMRLQEQGKLSTQDKICSHIAGCPAAWQPITIQEVLTTTSGIAGYDPFSPGITVDRTMADCKAMPLVSSPGSISPWSECNSFLLSAILQQVTGTSWEAAMQDLVFGPAGMTNSGRMTNALKPPQRGRFYRFGKPTPELNYDGTYLAYTTVEDLVRLNHALLSGTLLSPQSLTTLFKPWVQLNDRFPDGREVWYGYQSVMALATATLNKVVYESDINGNGEDNQGWQVGFFLTISVSPDDGAIAIDLTNDDTYFSNDDDNTFGTLTSKLMYGK